MSVSYRRALYSNGPLRPRAATGSGRSHGALGGHANRGRPGGDRCPRYSSRKEHRPFTNANTSGTRADSSSGTRADMMGADMAAISVPSVPGLHMANVTATR
jgi:hypothetical protein